MKHEQVRCADCRLHLEDERSAEQRLGVCSLTKRDVKLDSLRNCKKCCRSKSV